VEKLAKRQDGKGFWGHEYPNAFSTAAVVQSLHLARQSGVKVPERIVKLAAEAIRSTSGKDHTFMYDSRHNRVSPKDSSARSPVCESALYMAGNGSKEAVAKALDLYWEFYPRQEKVRKCDFHSDGELGGFFFFHAMFHATPGASSTITSWASATAPPWL
jgi:YD repeat-containing protein